MSAENILELKGITKCYPGVTALDSVSIEFRPGEVHALVGENGAGKSTMIKIMTGAIEPTEGTIYFNGKEFSRIDPIKAIDMGIGAVYQEFNLVPYLSVAENIFYGRELHKGVFLDKKTMWAETAKILEKLGTKMDAKRKVKDLTVAYQQMVEIAKSVSKNAKLLILDEPSAPLTEVEIKAMFKVIKSLKEKGVTIIYISHRMEEIFEISDRISVMRDGKHILTINTKDTDRRSLISLMVGRDLADVFPPSEKPIGKENMLKVEGLNNEYIKNISFGVKEGEILGLAGLVGAGRTETARAIFGADRLSSGNVYLNGKKLVIKSPKDAIKCGIALIPEDRKQHGVLLGMSIKENITYSSLKQISNYGWLNKSKEHKTVDILNKELLIKTPSTDQLVKNLSGGNQQKVVLAKWMATKCNVLIFDEPTRGIDVGAKFEIYKLMRKLAAEGKAIIMISSEMPELLGMSDRIVVMHEGYITAQMNREEVTQEKILEAASAHIEGVM